MRVGRRLSVRGVGLGSSELEWLGYLLPPLSVCLGLGDNERDGVEFRVFSAASAAPASSPSASAAATSALATESVDVMRPTFVGRSSCGTAPFLLQSTQTSREPRVGWARR